MISKLADYGHSFQLKLLSALISDRIFLIRVNNILAVEYFASDSMQEIYKIITKYFIKYKNIISPDALKAEVNEIKSDVLQTAVIANLKEIFQYFKSPDLPFIKEKTLDFCTNQNIKNAILTSVDYLEEGKYDLIKSTIDAALKAGGEVVLGHNYKTDVDARYAEDPRTVIPTPWDPINDLMDGGLGKGELGIIIGGPGSGKSWTLQGLAAHALKIGKNVLFYTLELNENYTARRIDAIVTGISSQNLKFHIDDIKDTASKLKGELNVRYFPEQSINLNGLMAHIEQFRMESGQPDLIVIDYVDLLKQTAYSAKDRNDLIIGDTYSMLRGMAGELQVPIWTATQANRSAAESDIIQGHQVSDAYAKIFKGDFIISLSRKTEDKISQTGRWYIVKNRFGPDGLTLPSKLNTSNGNISIFDPQSFSGKETQKEMDSEATVRKYLSSKYLELETEKE